MTTPLRMTIQERARLIARHKTGTDKVWQSYMDEAFNQLMDEAAAEAEADGGDERNSDR